MLVAGSADAPADVVALAEEVGRLLGEADAVTLCGGLGGVMEAACRGARSAGGPTVGLLPGLEREAGNAWLDVALPTGLGELRNGLLVRACDGVIAVGGGYGTLSEVAYGLKWGRPVASLRGWAIDGVAVADTPAAAVAAVL